MKNSVYIGLAFFLVGNVVAWIQFNSQFIWKAWEDRPILTNLIFGPIMGICFWYGTKNIVLSGNTLWTSKLLAFGVSNTVFALMTYLFMKESMFTPKTLTCLSLAALIIAIQIYWK